MDKMKEEVGIFSRPLFDYRKGSAFKLSLLFFI